MQKTLVPISGYSDIGTRESPAVPPYLAFVPAQSPALLMEALERLFPEAADRACTIPDSLGSLAADTFLLHRFQLSFSQ